MIHGRQPVLNQRQNGRPPRDNQNRIHALDGKYFKTSFRGTLTFVEPSGLQYAVQVRGDDGSSAWTAVEGSASVSAMDFDLLLEQGGGEDSQEHKRTASLSAATAATAATTDGAAADDVVAAPALADAGDVAIVGAGLLLQMLTL